jgi:hypothetical protein
MAKFKSDTERILEAISNHGSTFSEFCSEYSDTPERGDREGWADLFAKLKTESDTGYIEVERGSRYIESLRLTETGIAKLRELQASWK